MIQFERSLECRLSVRWSGSMRTFTKSVSSFTGNRKLGGIRRYCHGCKVASWPWLGITRACDHHCMLPGACVSCQFNVRMGFAALLEGEIIMAGDHIAVCCKCFNRPFELHVAACSGRSNQNSRCDSCVTEA